MFVTLIGMDLLHSADDVRAAATEAPLDELRDALITAASSISAAQCRMAQALSVFAARGGEGLGSGFTSVGQWASVDLGLSSRAASTLTRTGDALADLPTVRAAWESGELSTNKAQTVAGVATPESEASWRALALEASTTQLSRIASAYRRHGPDTPAPDASDREQRCGAQFSTRDDGLVELIAVLEPDDAAVVRAALEARMEMSWRDGDADDAESGSETTSPAPTGQRMADALVDLAASAQANDPTPIVRGERTEVVLHVDHEFLAGRTQVGRCQLTNTPGLDWHGARRLSCDARVRAMVHGADGRAVDLGRSQRLVSDKQRRLLTERDHGCRFPGCGNSRYVDAHHVTHWEDGGTTDLANLILLCNRHHRLQHQDAFTVTADGTGDFTFRDRRGRTLGPPRGRPRATAPDTPPCTTRARSGGNPDYSIDLAVAGLAGAAR